MDRLKPRAILFVIQMFANCSYCKKPCAYTYRDTTKEHTIFKKCISYRCGIISKITEEIIEQDD